MPRLSAMVLALAVIASTDLDWDYLVQRARHSPGRVASLLLFARSVDLVVPARVIATLVDSTRR